MLTNIYNCKLVKSLVRILLSALIFITSVGFTHFPENHKILNQNIEAVSLVQNASIEISSLLYEGGKVYFTIKIKNTGSATSPRIHPYIEGYTSTGQMFRADGSNPSSYAISPGSTKTFITQHDLWYGHAGAWSTYGIYLWNNDTNSYYGQLNANGYSQSKTFRVFGVNDVRQNGAIKVVGSPFDEGNKVYLDIPIKNFGSATSMPLHVYTEGYTSQNKLWRADGAQPTAVVLQAGQSTTIRVQHDLWYGHVGSWSTYGVYIWNDYNNSYFGKLEPNSYNQQLSFNVGSKPYQSLDILYLEDANKAISVRYDNISMNLDGSITVDLYVTNKRWVPFLWDVINIGYVTDRDGTITKIDSLNLFAPLPNKYTKKIEQVRFPQNSQITLMFSKIGNTTPQKNTLVIWNLTNFLAADVVGEIPTEENYQSFNSIISTISEGYFATLLSGSEKHVAVLASKFGLRDWRGVAEYMSENIGEFISLFEELSKILYKSPLLREKIVKAIGKIAFILHYEDVIKYLADLVLTPVAPTVKIVPSTRPNNSTLITNYSEPESISIFEHSELIGPTGSSINQLNATITACSSQHSLGFDPQLILDGNVNTGWTSALGDNTTEFFTLQLNGNSPALISSLQINPGPILNQHVASAIKNFSVQTSLNGIDYANLISGSFTLEELNKIKTFSFSPILAEYIRLTITQNQSDGSVKYMDLGDLLINGTSISANDIYEPDSTKEISRFLASDGRIENHNINHQQDIDWFYFMGKTGEKFLLSISTKASDLPVRIKVFQPNGNLIFEQIHQAGLLKNYPAILTQTGQFRVEISLAGTYGDLFKSPTLYSISLMNTTYQSFFPIINK